MLQIGVGRVDTVEHGRDGAGLGEPAAEGRVALGEFSELVERVELVGDGGGRGG